MLCNRTNNKSAVDTPYTLVNSLRGASWSGCPGFLCRSSKFDRGSPRTDRVYILTASWSAE